MDSLYLLIPIALVVFAVAMRFLFWAITSGQYDNLDTEAYRILFDDDERHMPAQKNHEKSHEKSDEKNHGENQEQTDKLEQSKQPGTQKGAGKQ